MIDESTVRPELVPEHLWDGVRNYVLYGRQTGSFLEAFFMNDLFEVFARGDEEALVGLRGLVMYVYDECPTGCRGSKEKVRLWGLHGGLEGLKRPQKFVDFDIQEDHLEFRTESGGEISEGIYVQARLFFDHAPVTRTHMEGNNDEEWVRFFFEPAITLEQADELEELFSTS